MEEKDVVRILQYYRHDLMNDLQVVQGYLSMDKIDKVKAKVNDSIEHYNEERKLISMNTPAWTLLVIQFNHLHENMRLNYQINFENKNLIAIDALLVKRFQQIVEKIKELGVKTELYELNLQINLELNSKVCVLITVDGCFEDKEDLVNGLLDVKETESGFICEYSFFV